MKNEIRNRNSDIQIFELQGAFLSIESLEEYYSNSILNVQKMKLQIEKEYQIGLFVDAEIKRAIDAKNKEEALSIIKELNSGIAPDGNLISDYIVVECIATDEDLDFSYSIKNWQTRRIRELEEEVAKLKNRTLWQQIWVDIKPRRKGNCYGRWYKWKMFGKKVFDVVLAVEYAVTVC